MSYISPWVFDEYREGDRNEHINQAGSKEFLRITVAAIQNVHGSDTGK